MTCVYVLNEPIIIIAKDKMQDAAVDDFFSTFLETNTYILTHFHYYYYLSANVFNSHNSVFLPGEVENSEWKPDRREWHPL